ncbi:MAG: YafY family transcriptional regulator [bacterium]|nr:YafY family transcriptional regulator [bacterium]
MRIDRMLAITVLLLNRERVSARELADKFEISIRTVYRDIDAINMAGIPIISYPGNNGGFGIMENYKLDHQLLTLKDMQTMLSALKGINTTLEDRELDTAIDKIKNLVPRDKTEQLELYLEQVVIDILPWGYGKKQKNKLKTIHKSLFGNTLLELNYRNTKGEESTRTVEPMTLLFKGYGWYLFAYCLLKNDYRLFRLSRIGELQALEEPFTRRNGSYQNMVQNKSDMPPEYIAHLVLKFSPRARVRVEDMFEDIKILIEDDGSLIVRIDFPEDSWVYSTILSYGEDVEVLEPPHIRGIIEKKAKKILALYNPDILLSQE